MNKLSKEEYVENLKRRMIDITSEIQKLQNQFPELAANSKLFISILTPENEEKTLIDFSSLRREESLENLMLSIEQDSFVVSEVNRLIGLLQAIDQSGSGYVKCLYETVDTESEFYPKVNETYKVIDYKIFQKELLLILENPEEESIGFSSYLFDANVIANMN